MSKSSIYFDYASTHPRIEDISKVREVFEKNSYANIGRGNYDLSESAMIAYQESKKMVSCWIGCEQMEVIYTYSATYACNILALAIRENSLLQKGDTILLSIAEHHANIVPWQMLAEKVGAAVRFVHLDKYFQLDVNDLQQKMDDTVKIVSLQYASNVTGAVHPLEKVRKIIGQDVLFFVDAAQMAYHGPISMKQIDCDALVFSGHKMGADTGIGVLALRRALQKSWASPISGGGAIQSVSQTGYTQAGAPERWEPGTPHITGAITLGAMISLLEKNLVRHEENYLGLISYVDECFSHISEKIQMYHSCAPTALGIWSFVVPGKHVTDVADIFSDEGICLRAGHHCCQPLHEYLGVHATLRLSVGFDTTREEVDRFFEVLHTIVV